MGISHESCRPMLAPNLTLPTDSAHSSVYSAAAYTFSSDSAQEEIYKIEAVLEKLENKQLATQRFIPSREKIDFLSKLALSAKLERALRRRMIEQDAVMRVRKSPSGVLEKTIDI